MNEAGSPAEKGVPRRPVTGAPVLSRTLLAGGASALQSQVNGAPTAQKTAFRVRVLGVVALPLAIVAGQILTAMVLDKITGAADVRIPTLASILVVLLAVILAVVPNGRTAPVSESTSEGAIHVRHK